MYTYIWHLLICCLFQSSPFSLTEDSACCVCHTADMSSASHSRCVRCVTQQPYMSAVAHSSQACRVIQWTCLLCRAADMSAVWYSRNTCLVTQQTCLLRQLTLVCDTADTVRCAI